MNESYGRLTVACAVQGVVVILALFCLTHRNKYGDRIHAPFLRLPFVLQIPSQCYRRVFIVPGVQGGGATSEAGACCACLTRVSLRRVAGQQVRGEIRVILRVYVCSFVL